MAIYTVNKFDLLNFYPDLLFFNGIELTYESGRPACLRTPFCGSLRGPKRNTAKIYIFPLGVSGNGPYISVDSLSRGPPTVICSKLALGL
jgi:hypothetical protein